MRLALQWQSHSVLALLTVNLVRFALLVPFSCFKELVLYDPFAGLELERRALGQLAPVLLSCAALASDLCALPPLLARLTRTSPLAEAEASLRHVVSYQHSLRLCDVRRILEDILLMA